MDTPAFKPGDIVGNIHADTEVGVVERIDGSGVVWVRWNTSYSLWPERAESLFHTDKPWSDMRPTLPKEHDE